jgi:trans-AT polyketide synthase, acyltransferase and oxidoreductase domains
MNGIGSISASRLGAERFRRRYGLAYAYMAGSMAHGVASEEFVEAMSGAGLLASFGAAGLGLDRIRLAVTRLKQSVPRERLCVNLIHSPLAEPLESGIVDLLLREGVTVVEASAFMQPTLPLVRLRAQGARLAPSGAVAPHRIIAKVSRCEVARHFLQPPPAAMLAQLRHEGVLSAQEAEAASLLPLADDITVEADSAGHTDNQSLLCAFPAIHALRQEVAQTFAPAASICLGAAGGLGTPSAVAAAFALGADYVVTGSINQACREAATSEQVKQMLARAEPADVAMTPAADMFEMGVRVQVLKRGTTFSLRGQLLYDLYRRHDGLDGLTAEERERIEQQLFRRPLAEVWAETRAYWQAIDPDQVARADTDAKLRMALVFRWYLGMSSRWAISGTPERALDYQIWCGPAMGAFNAWSRDTGFASIERRRAPDVAQALMEGAAAQLAALWGTSAPQPAGRTEPAPPLASAAPAPASAPDDRAIREWLIAQIAQQIGVPEEEIDPRQPFESYGIDSAAAVMILGRMEKYVGRRLSATLIWNYPTIEALAARLSAPLAPAPGSRQEPESALPPG